MSLAEKIVKGVFVLSALLLSCLVGLVLGFNIDVNAQELSTEEATEVELIKLRASDILYSETYKKPIYDGISEIIGYEDVVDYSYKGNEIDGSNIIFKDNNQFSNTEKLGDNTYKIHSDFDFYKNENGQVQEIVHTQTSQKVWTETTIKTTAEKISLLLKTPYVLADTYTPSGDRGLYKLNDGCDTWSNCCSGNATGQRDEVVYIRASYTSYYEAEHYFVNFDTSAISDTDEIATSSLWVYGDNAVAGSITMQIGTSTASDSPGTTDWAKFGKTALTTDKATGDLDADGWNELALNSTGTSTISKTGISKFAVVEKRMQSGTNPTGSNYFGVRTTLYSGSTYDPYLIVNTYTPEQEEEEETATTTIDFWPCGIPDNSRIDIITGCKNIYNGTTSSSTITAVEYYYYQIPFVIWVVLGTMFIYLFVRLRFEYIIRFRK